LDRLRILVLAPDANPESISVNLVCYRHAEALAQVHSVTLVGRACNEAALRRADGPFESVEAISVPGLDRIFEWSLKRIFKYNFRSNVLTAFGYPFAIAFEWYAWRRMRTDIIKEFDIVLRLSPIISVMPSAFPFFLRKTSVPFVIGPINGGLPWPKGFSQADNQKGWIDNLRSLYRILPFAKSTYRRASAIIGGSSNTCAEFSSYGDKIFFIPENGISTSVCDGAGRDGSTNGKLQLIFVGGLVPYKACDLALRGVASLLRIGKAHFTIAGDGPERDRLVELTKSLGIESQVTFCGMLSHTDVMQRLGASDVLVFPSVREFGGGVVIEALALGVVPVVANFGGPGDIVNSDVGFKVSLTNEQDVVAQIETVLSQLVDNRSLLKRLRRQGLAYARERLTWEAKAQATTRVLQWALTGGPKPDLAVQ
jgi:glycosyltransferase involved in cell wall biosynthesis